MTTHLLYSQLLPLPQSQICHFMLCKLRLSDHLILALSVQSGLLVLEPNMFLSKSLLFCLTTKRVKEEG